MSLTIRNLLEALPDLDEEIPLSNVTGDEFQKVVFGKNKNEIQKVVFGKHKNEKHLISCSILRSWNSASTTRYVLTCARAYLTLFLISLIFLLLSFFCLFVRTTLG